MTREVKVVTIVKIVNRKFMIYKKFLTCWLPRLPSPQT